MAEFVAFNPEVEVNRQTIQAFVNSMEMGKDIRMDTLKKYDINLQLGDWYSQQNWLNAFRDVAKNFGEMNLFLIGKAIISNADFPPMDGLEQALGSIDVAYHMNHRLNDKVMFNPETGTMLEGIGHYNLTSYDADAKSAVMVCNNPYPSKFDEGIIIQITRNFKPKGSIAPQVILDATKETRKDGGESCTYLISW